MKHLLILIIISMGISLNAQQIGGNAFFGYLGQTHESASAKQLFSQFKMLPGDQFIKEYASPTEYITTYGNPITKLMLGGGDGKKKSFSGKLPLGLYFGMHKNDFIKRMGNTTLFDIPSKQEFATTYFYYDVNRYAECYFTEDGKLHFIILENKDYRQLYDYWVKSGFNNQIKPENLVYWKNSDAATSLFENVSAPRVTVNNDEKLFSLLIELQKHMVPTAFEASWTGEKTKWLANCTPNRVLVTGIPIQRSLIELESMIKRSSFEEKWSWRAEPWRKECNDGIQSDVKVAQLLLELETNLSWASVDAAWAARRNAWVLECQSIKEVVDPNWNGEQEAEKFLFGK